ncbi:FAD binding domain-containing protein [Apiospora hydei]|uniref:FAD binding domain-containing protein n=1 Tax=Apiospora hydei TaxID=1337664 RepID=A0ABR1VVG7_9PEZI
MDVFEINLGGRLIPRSLVMSDGSATSLVSAIKSILVQGGIVAGVAMDVSRPPTFPNSVHSLWRVSLFMAFLGTYVSQNLMFCILALVEKLAHSCRIPTNSNSRLWSCSRRDNARGAAYLNEADIHQSDWQSVFYGANYPRLTAIKNVYDPDGIFWGPTAVGSEGWNAGLEYQSEESPTFLSAWDSLSTDSNVSDYNIGGKLIPRDLALDCSSQSLDTFHTVIH